MNPMGRDGAVRAAGVVVFTGPPGRERFLLLRNPLHREWGFPKGHLEEGEEDLAGALREAREETGIEEIEIEPGFRVEIRYPVLRGGRGRVGEAGLEKKVVYFLGRSPGEAHALSAEHDRSEWFTPSQALGRLKHGNLRAVARRAAAHLRRAARTKVR
ncbi:MAG TPA: NUDIX domain-containing protein [Planctomycetota bacterium]|jgi:8-oxo-dGTP pyrophosphatase MutT (NUDIX family)|nr:NUDIX domain-containing protein [Planctomycetota bacterium]